MSKIAREFNLPLPQEHVSTLEAARMLGMAVRSVQLMVDRGDLNAWKTPGGHRRITRESVEQWQRDTSLMVEPSTVGRRGRGRPKTVHPGPSVLLIEDSVHFQTLVRLLVTRHFPNLTLHVASDGIAGLAMAGQFQPDILLVDILLPGIDGATLITSLRSHQQFEAMQLVVITSMEGDQLIPYATALHGVPLIHKPKLAIDLPILLGDALQRVRGNAAVPATTAASEVVAGAAA